MPLCSIGFVSEISQIAEQSMDFKMNDVTTSAIWNEISVTVLGLIHLNRLRMTDGIADIHGLVEE